MALTFSDADYITLGDNVDQRGMATITFCCWGKRNGPEGANDAWLWAKPYSTSGSPMTWGIWQGTTPGDPGLFRIRTTSGNVLVVANTSLADDTWYHFAGRYDGTDFDVFLDGVNDGTGTSSGNIENDSSTQFDVAVGNASVQPTIRGFDGVVCECAMWNRNLSNSEISAVYRFGVLSIPNSLVIYMPINGNPTTEREMINNRGTVTMFGTPPKAEHAPIPTIGSRLSGPMISTPPPPIVGGVHSILRAASTGDSITEWNRQRNRPRRIEDLVDIDDL